MAGGSKLREAVRDDLWGTLRRLLGWAARSYVVIVILGIVVGLQVAPAVSDLATEPVSGTVAVIPLEGSIDGTNAASTIARLKRARSDPDVEAVVLQVNSGGGGAASSESIYLEVKRTARRMPVVTSVNGIAASGAYYSAAPTDLIYVKPASFIGSVGVFFVAPQPLPPLDQLITTGPNKLTGADRREWFYKIEADRRGFARAVMKGRGDRLKLSEAELSHAKLYTGAEAVDNGVADRIGGITAAVERAAEMADLTRYRVKVFGYNGTQVQYVTRSAYVASGVENRELVPPSTVIVSPAEATGPNLVMLPPSVVRAAIVDSTQNATRVQPRTGVNGNATVAAG